jgi:hypothetical protein
MTQFSPKPISIPLGPFRIFSKIRGDFFASQCAPLVSTTPAVPVANLPPVSSIPVVHLNLQISPRMFEKFEMTLMLFLGAWGNMIHEKNLKQKIS